MKVFVWAFLFAFSLGMGAIVSAAPSPELTGLADFGSIHLACIKLGENSEGLTLHPGETVSGLMLKELHVKEGWALFERGTNEFRLRLANYTSSSIAPIARRAPATAGPPATGKLGLSRWESTGSPTGSEPSSPVGYPSAQSGSEPPAPPAWTSPYAPQQQTPKGSHANPQVPAMSGSALGSATAQPSAQQDVAAADPAQLAPLAASDNNNSADNADTGGLASAGAHPTSAPTDPQAEQILMYYGREAYLAWDMQRWRQQNGQ